MTVRNDYLMDPFVKNKDNTIQMYTGYMQLNKMKVKNVTPYLVLMISLTNFRVLWYF